MANDKPPKVVNDEEVAISSFELYESSNDDTTKIVDGEKVIRDFHLYPVDLTVYSEDVDESDSENGE